MNQKKIFIGILMVFLYLSVWIGAQEKPLKIACVDLDRIMAESGAIRQIVGTVQDDIKKEQESLADKMTRYKALAQTLEEQKTILTQEQVKTRRKEIDDLKVTIEDQQQDINRMIRRSERELVEPAIDLVDRAIKTVSEKENLDLVLRNDLVLFASERCNITDRVIPMIDDLYKQEKEKEQQKESPPPEQKEEATPSPAPAPN